MCSAFTAGCGYDNSTIILIGDVYCPIKKCSGRLCLHKKIFQSLGRSSYQCPQSASICQVRNIPFEEILFLVAWPICLHFEENPKSVQDVIGDVYCPGKDCSNRVKCESFGGYVTTPSSIYAIYACGKCGAWLFVHKVPFMLQEHVKTTKTVETRFFAGKR